MSLSVYKRSLVRCAAVAAIAASYATALSAQTARPSLSRYSLSYGCGKDPASTGLSKVSTKDGKWMNRTYLMLVPKDYNPHKTYSLVFVFHGSGASAEASMSWGLQNAPGAAESAIFVFPQGIQYYGGQAGWDDTPRGYDMPLFDNMVSEVESGYCIDMDEVFVAGFSWGGDFSIVLTCARGDAIRAVEVNSGGGEFKDKSDFRTYKYLPCPSHIHPAVRYEHAVDGDSAYPAPTFATASQFFAAENQCSGAPKSVPSSDPAISCRVFEGCAKAYVECPFNTRIGHGIPPNWAQDTWQFFSSFRHADRDVSHYR
jgi:polyhydroxybutyrate depolymerase